MKRSVRTALGGLAALWIMGLLGAMVWAHWPREVTAKAVPAGEIERALQRPAGTPISWCRGQAEVPLLPVRGQYLVRDGDLFLAGAALVSGSLAQARYSATVEYLPAPVHVYGQLEGPLLPFMRRAGPAGIPETQCVDLWCGVQQAVAGNLRGLHVRRDRGLSVLGPDSETELFPGRGYVAAASLIWKNLGIAVDGKHVVVSADGQPVFDFHLAQPLTGAVALDTHDGAAIINRIEVR